MSASVLSKAFAGILLNSYSNVKIVTSVNSFLEIVDNKGLPVSGSNESLEKFSEEYQYNLDDILDRVNRDPDNFPDGILSVKAAEKVLKSESFLVVNTFQRKIFLDLTRNYHDKLVVADGKLFPEFMSLFVCKYKPFTKLVKF